MSIAQRNMTDETKRKMSIAKSNMSDETKLKISIASKGVPKQVITCPHCGKSGGISGMKRYHFDKCKLYK